MKKILFLITNLAHGGAERVLVNLANNLDKSKYDITIETIFDDGVNKKYLSPEIHYRYIFPKTFHGIKYITKYLPAKLLHKLFIKEKYDVEIAYLEGPPAKIISGADKTVKKLSWIHIELLTTQALTEGFLNKKEAVSTYESFDKIICVSQTVKEAFSKISGITNNLEVKYNTNESEKIKRLAKETVTDIEFNPEVINICSVAKIEHSKGYDRLIEVHERLIHDGIKHHIYVLGIGSEKERLETLLEEKGLSDSFTFLGFKENPYKYVANCDLYVCSSRREGFSTAVTEALILGMPCISTNCSGAYELLGKNNEYGIVTENNTEALYEVMKRYLNNKKTMEHYKQRAGERGEYFNTRKTIEEIEKMFDEVLR